MNDPKPPKWLKAEIRRRGIEATPKEVFDSWLKFWATETTLDDMEVFLLGWKNGEDGVEDE